ncbi:hypothetical protein F5Y19DRAFT_464908 [Xylariaceae sp. FL1651]|nr:hypothetical protein F5Y19DRAFT_464908 [Xylariaceae sp. FL1651]
MDSPASAARGRGRASARKRHTLPAGPSHLGTNSNTAAESFDQFQLSSGTPAASIASSSFSFETPSPSASRGTRARARITEGTIPSSDGLDSKGGRSLRKRARVDYTFDHVDEDISDSNKATPFATRALKKRRTDSVLHDMETDEEFNARVKRRSSEQPPPPSSAFRRRNQARKSTLEPQSFISDHNMEDVEVQDTIEVGGHQSEQSDESTLRRTSSGTSSGTSSNDLKQSQMMASFSSIPSPRASFPNLIQADTREDYHQNHIEQPETTHTSLPDASSNLADESLHVSYEILTPYIDGAFVEWPSIQPEAGNDTEPQPIQEEAAEELTEDQFDGTRLGSTQADTAQEDTPIADSHVPDSTPVDGAVEETPVASPGPLDTTVNSPAADIELSYVQPPPRKPIAFKQTRDAAEFISLFDNYKSLQPDEIWRRLDVVNRALSAWQSEYNELRKLTDDEDNAARYRQEELAFQHRVKMLTSKDPEANPIQKDFVVKGIRAERPDPEIAYARQQDKLMAINYLFEYDDKESKIGYQDPMEQKPGHGKGRLRDRPKQTAKAAEADDANVVHGKRARKPPALYDGLEAASRGSTPVPPQRRRRRAGQATEDNSEANPAILASTDPSEQPPPKKKGKGGRPRKHPLPVPIPEDPPAPVEEVQQQPEEVEGEKPTRKRRRRRTAVKVVEEEEEAPSTNGIERQTPAKARFRRTNSQFSEVPSGSFYTSSMQSTNNGDESRPPTSSSTATQSTVASNNYQLREKRQKKFSLNPDDDDYDGEPKPKRVRRSKKTQVEDFASTLAPIPAPSPMPVQQLMPNLAPIPKPPTKIKIKNYNGFVSGPPVTSVPNPNPFSVPSSSNSTPPHNGNGTSNGALNGIDPADAKDYNQMTKSEKMSHSMKARWASGSMSQAVAKRRATLANKKQAVKASSPGQPLEAAPAVQ